MISKTFLFLACTSLAISSPIAAPADSTNGPVAGQAAAKYFKDALANEFKGLWWNHAFEKDENNKQECTDQMLDVLVPALRKTREFTGLLTDPSRKDYNSDGAWHTFYVRPNPDGKKIVDRDWNANDENKAAFKAINDNAKSAATFPFTGGSGSLAQTASIRCKEALPNDRDRFCSKYALLPAYTTSPAGTGENTWITFCPKFFADNDIPNLDDLTKNKKRSSELFALRSREHIIAHEFMHVKRFGYRTFIDDLNDDKVGGPVYGGSRCQDYGFLYLKDRPSKVNVKQEINADTYAWWFTAVWFQTKWNWPYDPKSTAKPGWTDANGALNQFDDHTSDENGVQGDQSVFGDQSTHGGAPVPSSCPGC